MPEASSGRGRRGQDDDGEQGFIRNDPPELEDTYRFSFDANWLVTSMVEIDDGVEKVKDLTGRTFTVTTGVNDLQQTDAVEVIQTRVKRGVSETTVFEDQDGDDIYTQAFELEIYGADARPNKVEEYQFTFDTNGDVTGYSKLKKGVWVAKSIDANESFETLDLSGTTVVAKTEVEGTEVEIEFFWEDPANAGVWREVAEAEMQVGSTYYDALVMGPSAELALMVGFVWFGAAAG